MNVDRLQQIFNSRRNSLAFIIGNGINRYNGTNSLSWNNLLKKLWQRVTNQTQNIPNGITLTEYYDVIELNDNRNNSPHEVQKEVRDLLSSWEPKAYQQKIIERVKDLDCPILTTNYDEVFKKALGLQFFMMENREIGFTDYYPWEAYHSNRPLNSPTDGFGIWYINGMIKYYRSIRLGLSHYMGSVQKARRLIHNNDAELFHGKNQRNWIGHHTWLHILFNKSIVISGLGLNAQETFLRWLLLERAKYFKKFSHRRKKGWYIYNENEEDLERNGKLFFLKQVGIEPIAFSSYKALYEDIWQ